MCLSRRVTIISGTARYFRDDARRYTDVHIRLQRKEICRPDRRSKSTGTLQFVTYSIQDDMYHAHFDLPEKDNAPRSSQSAIKENVGPALKPGNYHHWNSSQEAVLAGACSDIDLYFDE